MESWIDAYPDLKSEPLERKAKGDQVFVWVGLSGHRAGSGAPIEMKLARVVTLRDEKLARVDESYDRSEALEAVGFGGVGRLAGEVMHDLFAVTDDGSKRAICGPVTAYF
jgi:hypothetical protein